MRVCWIALLAVTAVAAFGETDIRQSDISTDTTWGLSGSPYYIYGDIKVLNGAALTVEAGVSVLFAEIHGDGGYEDGAEMVVRSGSLITKGTSSMPVTFTSANGVKKMGDWGAIIVEGNNQYVLENAVIEYAKNGLRLYNFTTAGASRSSAEGASIRHCLNNGVYCYYSAADLYHVSITKNGYAGVKTSGTCNVSARRCDLNDNGMYNFYNGSSQNVDATECWWGTTSAGLIELRIYDRHDSPVSGSVDYTPYLTDSWREGGGVNNYSIGLVKSLFK